jgi:DivIVA domain-containing protein
MALTAHEIQNRRFALGIRGYEKDEVESFLAQVAADYQLALDAMASADPYGAIGREVSDVLRYAKESAETFSRSAHEESRRIVREASEEAARIREQSAEEAAATLEQAREEAARVKAEGEVRAREAQDQAELLRRRAHEEFAGARRQAEEEAAATLEGAGEKAVALVREAESHARELRESAEAKYHQRLGEATQRHAQLRAQEQELNDRVVEVAKTLQRLLAQLHPEDAALSQGLARVTSDSEGDRVVDLRDADETSAGG